jgi:putative hemolysin
MTALELLTLFGVGLCLLLSFLFSGMEAGVFALSRLRIRRAMRSGRSSAQVLHGFLENPEKFLWTILVGNTIVNFAIIAWMVPQLHQWLRGRLWLFVAIFIVFIFVFYALSDLLPKMLFSTFPNRLCMFFAKPFKFVYLALRPFVALVEHASAFLLRWTGGKTFTGRLFGNREELRQVMQETAQDLSTDERAMINRVLDLQTLAVRQIATPLMQVVMVAAGTPTREALTLARERELGRLPVWEMRDRRRRIIGIVIVYKLLYESSPDMEKPISAHIRPAIFLNENLRLETALRRMQRSNQRLAVVLDRDGNETGVISLEDILKAIFGEVKL